MPRHRNRQPGQRRPRPAVDVAEAVRALAPGLRSLPIEALGPIPLRLWRLLHTLQIQRIDDLLTHSEPSMLRLRNVGLTTLAALVKALRALGRRGGAAGILPATPLVRLQAAIKALPTEACRELPVGLLMGHPHLPMSAADGLATRPLRSLLDATSVTDLNLTAFASRKLNVLTEQAQELLKSLRAVATDESMTTDGLMDALAREEPLLEAIDRRCRDLSRGQSRTLRRWLAAPPEAGTLEALGGLLGVSRERVHQVLGRTRERARRPPDLVERADRAIEAARRGRASPLSVKELERVDGWFAGAASDPRRWERWLSVLGSRHAVLDLPGTDEPVMTLRAEAQLNRMLVHIRRHISGAGALATDRAALSRALAALGIPEFLPVAERLLSPGAAAFPAAKEAATTTRDARRRGPRRG